MTAVVLLGLLVGPIGSRAAEQGSASGRPSVDPAIGVYVPEKSLSGRISIAGSDTMRPLMSKLAAQFMSLHPNVHFAVEGTGSSSAIREFSLGFSYQRRGDKARGKGTEGSNEVEILATSRGLTKEELRAFEISNGYQPVGIPVALDAVAIYVHRDNPIPQLTLEQIDAIYGKERKRGLANALTTWEQAGVGNGIAKQPIHLYGRDKRSGTRDFFQHVALKDGDLRPDIIEQPGSASEIIAIAQDPLAIGYAGIGYQISAVRMVPIAPQAGHSPVFPSQASVESGSYPLARELYLYMKLPPGEALQALVAEFLKFVNSRQGQETVARANYCPISANQVAMNLERIGYDTVVANTNPVRHTP